MDTFVPFIVFFQCVISLQFSVVDVIIPENTQRGKYNIFAWADAKLGHFLFKKHPPT